jgi:recombination protein U
MKTSYANRGKLFQNIINYANNQYRLKGWGLIDEVPTPIQITESRANYVKGYKKGKSTVDYVGIANGRGIAFDAKSTKETTRFPLDNVHKHQVEYLKRYEDQGGIAFLLVYFESLKETYFVPIQWFLYYWNEAKKGGKKSIPYAHFQMDLRQVKQEKGIVLHYLKYCG